MKNIIAATVLAAAIIVLGVTALVRTEQRVMRQMRTPAAVPSHSL